MKLTERDQHLFRWINGHGFVTVKQASAWMGTNYQAGQRRMQKLAEAGFLTRKRVLHGDKRIHWVTKKALAACGDNLAPPQTIGLGSYRHDLVLVDVAQAVVDQNGGDFVPARRPVYTVFDEFSVFAGEQVLNVINMCSGLRLSALGREIIAISGSDYLRL